MIETKNAHEGVVTSIADTDLVMVVGPNGGLHPISFENLMKAVRGEIQIGGRNLLKNTADFKCQTSATSWMTGMLSIPKEKLVGRVLTFSCKYRKTGSPSGNASIGTIVSDSWWDMATINTESAPAAGTLVKTFYSVTERFAPHASSQQGFELYDFKLEEGNMATAWTPAPEDIASGSWGGGKLLPFNKLRNLAERRVA